MPIERGHNLPAPRDRLIGRTQEIAAMRELLVGDTHRLVTLTGLGGAGKTRLALEVVWMLRDSFPDGVWLVELAGVVDDALLPDVIAAALGMLQPTELPTTEALVAFLRPRSLLLVLDNCEHLIEATAKLAERLLNSCPGLRILTTSREPLQIAGERQFRLGPLALPATEQIASVEEIAHSPAVELFVERARAVAPDFALSAQNALVVASICIRVDGVPLALELAAARVRILTLEQILARLDDSIRLLTGGNRPGPTRQQTLKATLDWSYDLLSDNERAVLRRLSIFAAGCVLDAAEAVCSAGDVAPENVLEVLARLLDKSLLVVDRTAATARYRLLEPVRQYAGQRLDAAGERARAETAHATFYRALAEQSAAFLRGPEQICWLDRLEGEQGNLRVAIRWALTEGDVAFGLRLAVAVAPFWEARGRLREGRRWLELLLAVPDAETLPTDLRARGLLAAGRLAQWQADLSAADAMLQAALELARPLDNHPLIVETLVYLGMVRRHQGALAESRHLLTEGLEHARSAGDEVGAALALVTLAVTVRRQGDVGASVPLLEESLAGFQRAGDRRWIANTQTMLGGSLVRLGELDRAERTLLDGLAGHQAVGDLTFSAFGLLCLAAVLAAQGQPQWAARMLGAMLAVVERAGAGLSPASQREYDEVAAAVRAQISAIDFDRAWAEGSVLTLDQLLAAAQRIASERAQVLPSAGPPDALRDVLTKREFEVAQLVSQGLTDRQIGEMLSISSATVGVHIHHLLEKLGLRSRWQVAAALGERPPHDPSP